MASTTQEKFKLPVRKAPKNCDAVFDGYTGGRIWTVSHPDHKPVKVLAPTEQAAIVAAAKAWKTDWTRELFYSRASVRPTA